MDTVYGMMFDMAARAKELAGCTIEQLRVKATPVEKWGHRWTKGGLIERILIQEFSERAMELDKKEKS